MKKTFFFSMFTTAIIMMSGCSTDEPYEDNNSGNNGWNSGGNSSTNGELSTFDVVIDKTSAEPETTASEYFPDDEDALENNEFSTEVSIDLSNPVAKMEGGVEVAVIGNHITVNHGSTKSVCYVVSGNTTNGSLTVLGDKKYAVKLNGATITNPDSAALNLLSSKRAYIILAEGTTNTLADGTGGSQKGALYCKGKLLFNGSGSLNVTGKINNGIHVADYIVFNKGNNIYVKSLANHGIKANDGVYINGGILNVEVSAAAAKGINCESHIFVNGGRTTILTTGNGTYDSEDREAKGSAGIKADSTFVMNGGELWLKNTGSGGKGINVDMMTNFSGGSVYVVTSGGLYKSNNDTASPKGIKGDGNITFSGGRIWVRTSGSSGEGIESKGTLSITGGEVASYASDDAINSAGNMTISGGYVMANSTGNDGIDANGNLYVKGGNVFAIGTSSPEVGLDANTEGGYALYITGGNVVAIGGLESGCSISNGSAYQASSYSKGAWYALLNGGAAAFAFKVPSNSKMGTPLCVYTSGTASLLSGVTGSGTALWDGNGYTGYSGGSSVSLSEYSNNSGPGGGGRW